jgi:hypothetical protein
MKNTDDSLIIEKLDRMIELSANMEKRLDLLLEFIREQKNPAKQEPKLFNKTYDSDIMRKYEEFMMRKDPKNDMSTFDSDVDQESKDIFL